MRYCILGAAKSGVAAAILANTINCNSIKNFNNANLNCANNNSITDSVFVRELLPQENFSNEVMLFDSLGIKYEFGAESQNITKAETTLPYCDFLIISPGVPSNVPFILTAKRLGIPVYSELELASQHIKNPIIAITGTNGKTTTTTLINYILNHSGINAVAAGNIGVPLSEIATKLLNKDKSITKDTIIVLEVSSYQLEFIEKFKPSVAIILNITPDHLKYHKTIAHYIDVKLKIARNQDVNDILILNADDENINFNNVEEFKKKNNIKSKIYQFSLSTVNRGIYIADGKVINSIQQAKEEIMTTKEIKIPGVHNQYNSMAAAIVAKVWQLSNENIRDSLNKFNGVEHRLEFVRTINGVDYINDSKATNVNATWYALNSYERPLIWIAGGRGDNNDYSMLDEAVSKNVRKIITFGEEKETIYIRYSEMVCCTKVENIHSAINTAYSTAKQNDIVLFSPACKSFDQFINFEQRGECFKQAVHQLIAMLN
jgi:UDP-N-acetylmuramoylalanine--D-glutamate ligase